MKKVLLMSLLCLWGVGMQGADTSILDFGAHQNSADNTKAIQAAIDSCALTGGGTIHIPSGTYLTSLFAWREYT